MSRLRILATALFAFSAAANAADPALGIRLPGQEGSSDQSQSVMPQEPAKAQIEATTSATKGKTPEVQPDAPQLFDYSSNVKSEIFGAQLFTGSFARPGAAQFNPDYMLAIGDKVHVRLWGGYTFDNMLTVDPQGNLFLPYVGPVKAVGVRNSDLQKAVEKAVRQEFRNNVYVYASLAGAQPVRIFVSGFVNRPGLYNGTSMDSLLHYLDQAGGIDPERGSFLEVQVKRGEQVRATVNFYNFLLKGMLPQIQLGDGDVIFVAPRQNTTRVFGEVENAKRFEFAGPSITLGDLSAIVRPRATVTHVRVTRNSGTTRNVEYYALADAAGVTLKNGDEVEYTADKKPGTITVRVEGEHLSPQEYVLPYGAKVGDLLQQIRLSDRSDASSMQLFRQSVRERQKALLAASMKSLESTVLTARSGTNEEARLRKDEAELILQWVERAKKVEPNGQVLIAQASTKDALLLEHGDVIRIPARDGLVLVGGEVLFPNAVAFEGGRSVQDYIGLTGGYTQNADNSRVIVAHRNGSFEDAASNPAIRPGDEILVLPKIDVKSRQIWKDLTQIVYQIAVGAKVVFGL